MRQRLGVADALVKHPSVLILDEPTVNIDPEGVRELLLLVERLRSDQGVTVLLSSHLLHQVEQVCDRIGIFVRGRLVAVGHGRRAGRRRSTTVGCSTSAWPASTTPRHAAPRARRRRCVIGARVAGRCTPTATSAASSSDRVADAGGCLTHLSREGADLDAIYHRYFTRGRRGPPPHRPCRRRAPRHDGRRDGRPSSRAASPLPRRLAHRGPQGVHRPRRARSGSCCSSCSCRSPVWPRSTRRAGRSATPPTPPRRRRRSSSTCSRCRPQRVPAFHEFLGILGPLLGIAFGFDAINGERSQGTLPRLVVAADPPRRDHQRQVRRRHRRHRAGAGVVMAIVGGYGALRLGVGPSVRPRPGRRVLPRRRRVHLAVAGAVALAVGGLPHGPPPPRSRRSPSGWCSRCSAG